MDWNEWKWIYEEILKDFGFDRKKDEEAARILNELLMARDEKVNIERLIRSREVFVCGNGPSLKYDISLLDSKRGKTFIAADGTTSTLLARDILPHVVVSDLDGNMDDIIYANKMGAVIVVHAHGDNIEALKKFVPKLRNIIGTTQAKPFGKLFNFGGFTDGDRCVFLAKELGATSIKLLGFDFGDMGVGESKRKKLKWAEKLVRAAGLQV
jgi:hypothetical protein